MKFAIVFSREVLWAVADSLEEVVPMNYTCERNLVREYLSSTHANVGIWHVFSSLADVYFHLFRLNKIAVPYTLASRGTTIL